MAKRQISIVVDESVLRELDKSAQGEERSRSWMIEVSLREMLGMKKDIKDIKDGGDNG